MALASSGIIHPENCLVSPMHVHMQALGPSRINPPPVSKVVQEVGHSVFVLFN